MNDSKVEIKIRCHGCGRWLVDSGKRLTDEENETYIYLDNKVSCIEVELAPKVLSKLDLDDSKVYAVTHALIESLSLAKLEYALFRDSLTEKYNIPLEGFTVIDKRILIHE